MLLELRKCLKSEKNNQSIFDILVYGSLVKGKHKPKDLDILVIFREGTLKDRLAKIQEIKKKINLDIKIDIKGILIEELFKEEFFARSGVILEGISVFSDKKFAYRLGFTSVTIFTYNLKNKTHNEKVKFNYVLSGRNSEGMIKNLDGNHISPGVVQIPIENSLEFESVLQMHNITYNKVNSLLQR